jgi:cobalamin biosynthesis protein CbiD
MVRQEASPLRRGWTTGACAAAAARKVAIVDRGGDFLARVGT